MKRSISLIALLIFSSTALQADDWPQFGGVNRDGISKETGLLKSWPKGGPKLAWKAGGNGIGWSSMAVVKNRIYTIGDIDDQQFLIALNRANGKQVWKQKIGNANKTGYPGSRSTPTYANDTIYALSSEGKLFCVNAKDGKVVWQKNLVKEFGAQLMLAMGKYQWEFSESPLVDGDLVVVTPGANNAAMVALNCKTGKLAWQTKLPGADVLGNRGADGAGYSSIVVAKIHGKKQFIQLYGRGVMSVDAETGKYLWGYNGVANKIANISSAAVSGNRVFVSTGYQTGSALLEIDYAQEKWSVKEKYFLNNRKFQNHHGGFVLYNGHIYGGHGHKKGFPTCINFDTGKIAWGPKRNQGKGSASVAFADGHVYMRYEDGLMVLVEATASGYKEKGSFMIPNVKAKSWSRPVIAGKKLYLKEQDTIYCYDIAG